MSTNQCHITMKLRVAIELFQDKKVTLVQASQIAGLHQSQFQKELARRKIPIHYDINDFEADMQTLNVVFSVK